MNRTAMGLAIGAGYLLGRTKKLKMALAVGSLVAGKKLNLSPKMLADVVSQQLKNNPQFKEIGDQLRQDLRGVGKAASGAMVERQMNTLADRLHGRTSQVRDQLSGVAPGSDEEQGDEDGYEDDYEESADREDEDREDEDRGDDREDREDKPRGKEQAKREPAKKAPAKKAPAKKAAAQKTAPAKKTAAKKTTSARKTAAKKTAAAGGTTRRATGRPSKGGDDR
ncbi:DNA primase [Streptomyces sp. SID161]|uniref:DNA primase n=1 Tax=Streptomyces sp. SID161 TaxID=2690251 RepID=UPI001368BCBE|nr:DNA primase [Streptomyces sp. SID161]MYW14168.1 DNA primase [Streptomyces sp. SID2955]MYW49184.1 DNA primase [Streptomyces sp. SID161]